MAIPNGPTYDDDDIDYSDIEAKSVLYDIVTSIQC